MTLPNQRSPRARDVNKLGAEIFLCQRQSRN
jgi:hypothetical protein